MILRNTLLALGLLATMTGAILSLLVMGPASWHRVPPNPMPLHQEILVAARPIAAGTLLRLDDMAWQKVSPDTVFQGSLQRGEIDKEAFAGAVARRDFGMGEPLFAASLVRPGDHGFLAAVLAPGNRAVSVPADAPQTAAGLMLPGDHVDVILTQTFNDAARDTAHRSVGETILRDLRVIAVDQRISPLAPAGGADARGIAPDAHVPKTVTLEVTPEQAQTLFVAIQLGRIELALRSLANPPGSLLGRLLTRPGPTWAADVSPALRTAVPQPAQEAATPAEPERPKIEVMHGTKTELR
jgi:pilus assembly protein CpaB